MEQSHQQCSKAREVGRAMAKSRDTEALSVLNLPNYRLAALSQVILYCSVGLWTLAP